MKNKAYRITGYSFTPADSLLLDANIWLYVYGPQGSPTDWKSQAYSRALADALRGGSVLYIDVLILSEFVNRYARLEHNILRTQGVAPNDFKMFRNSPVFKSTAQSIAQDVRRILKHGTRVESDFAVVDINQLLSEFEQGRCDFNDQVLTGLCRAKGYKLVTHDVDFRNCGLTVLTANPRLL